MPVRYPLYLLARYPTVVSIFKDDGTVAVSTGGVEMGQGLNTKVRTVVNRAEIMEQGAITTVSIHGTSRFSGQAVCMLPLPG